MRAPSPAECLCPLTSVRRMLPAVWRAVPVGDGIWNPAPRLCVVMVQDKGLASSMPWEKRPTAARYDTGGMSHREFNKKPDVQPRLAHASIPPNL